MKRLRLLLALALLFAQSAAAQITITAADMPVNGDTLRYSAADPFNVAIDLTVTGANSTWDFRGLVAVAQGVDTYKTAAQVNSAYATAIPAPAYGYKVSDSFPGAPISVEQLYNFFAKKTSPDRFVVVGFAAEVAGFPTPVPYSDEDEVYYFPLQFGNTNTSTFRLNYTQLFGSLSQEGTRTTTVDGWGTIQTPYTTAPVQVIRVRSEVVEFDTIRFAGQEIGVPRHFVEYKWLANGEHYPLMFVTTEVNNGTETTSDISYRDTRRSVGLLDARPAVQHIALFPNPAGKEVVLRVPASWSTYSVAVYDAQGRLVHQQQNAATVPTAALPAGSYFVRVQHGAELGLAQFIR